MSYLMITVRQIEVIGRIWQPGMDTCGMAYNLKTSDVEQIKALGGGELTRAACEKWLHSHAGDFQEIEDFHADIEDFDSPWAHEESGMTFTSCMGG